MANTHNAAARKPVATPASAQATQRAARLIRVGAAVELVRGGKYGRYYDYYRRYTRYRYWAGRRQRCRSRNSTRTTLPAPSRAGPAAGPAQGRARWRLFP